MTTLKRSLTTRIKEKFQKGKKMTPSVSIDSSLSSFISLDDNKTADQISRRRTFSISSLRHCEAKVLSIDTGKPQSADCLLPPVAAQEMPELEPSSSNQTTQESPHTAASFMIPESIVPNEPREIAEESTADAVATSILEKVQQDAQNLQPITSGQRLDANWCI